jgi:CubicO group peptidase (beta-lactamase class C family)
MKMCFARAHRVGALLFACILASCGGGGDGGDGGGSTTPPQEFHPSGATIPASGPNVPGAEPFDQGVTALMRKWNIPGAAIAVAKDGKLILARGYGYADFEGKQPTQPDSMFRVASVSKVLTSLAILRLRDQGLLDLDQTFLSILTEYQLPANGDARVRNITIRNLLMHLGGWDRDIAGDPLATQDRVSEALGVAKPVTCADTVRYMLTQPLQYDPGTRYAYSNFGYCILGRVIAKVSGQSYESFVRDQVLAPIGVYAMSVGQSHVTQRGPFEVKYYPYNGEALRESVFSGEGKVPAPYSVDMLTHESSGGWIASAIDLTRVMTAIDGSRVSGLLSADSRLQLTAKPNPSFTGTGWYGFGLFVGPTVDTYYHGGVLSGTGSRLDHEASGYTFAILVNTQPSNVNTFGQEMGSMMVQALGAGLTGSATDLYAQYASPSLPARTP